MSRKAKASRMRKLVAKYHQSGASLSQFARTHGMSRGKLHYWVDRFQETPPTGASPDQEASTKFIPIDLTTRSSIEPSYIIINKPCGTQIKIPL